MPISNDAIPISASSTLVSQADVEGLLGITMTAAQVTTFNLINLGVERQVEREIGQNLLQPAEPFVELLPGAEFRPAPDQLLTLPRNSRGSYHYREPASSQLELRRGLVRELVEVKVDSTREFAAGTELAIGTACFLDFDEEDYGGLQDPLSMSGIVYRDFGVWPSEPRTVRVVYVAGITAAELSDQFYDLKLALIEEVARRFKAQVQNHGVDTDSFPVQSESIGGQHSITYATGGLTIQRQLSPELLYLLNAFRRWNLG